MTLDEVQECGSLCEVSLFTQVFIMKRQGYLDSPLLIVRGCCFELAENC